MAERVCASSGMAASSPTLNLAAAARQHLEGGLEKGLAGRVAQRRQLGHQLVERHLGVFLAFGQGGAGGGQGLGEIRIAGQPDVQRQHIDEKADHAFVIELLAAGLGNAQHHLVLAEPAREQEVPGGQQHREKRAARPPRQRLELAAQLGRP